MHITCWQALCCTGLVCRMRPEHTVRHRLPLRKGRATGEGGEGHRRGEGCEGRGVRGGCEGRDVRGGVLGEGC